MDPLRGITKTLPDATPLVTSLLALTRHTHATTRWRPRVSGTPRPDAGVSSVIRRHWSNCPSWRRARLFGLTPVALSPTAVAANSLCRHAPYPRPKHRARSHRQPRPSCREHHHDWSVECNQQLVSCPRNRASTRLLQCCQRTPQPGGHGSARSWQHSTDAAHRACALHLTATRDDLDATPDPPRTRPCGWGRPHVAPDVGVRRTGRRCR